MTELAVDALLVAPDDKAGAGQQEDAKRGPTTELEAVDAHATKAADGKAVNRPWQNTRTPMTDAGEVDKAFVGLVEVKKNHADDRQGSRRQSGGRTPQGGCRHVLRCRPGAVGNWDLSSQASEVSLLVFTTKRLRHNAFS
jgi:hypothetical protein